MKTTWKTNILKTHAKKAFLKRFGIKLNHALGREIMQTIRRGKAVLVCQESCTKFVYRLTIENKLVDVVYDRHRGQIVTCLYPTDNPPRYRAVVYIDNQKLDAGEYSTHKRAVVAAINIIGKDGSYKITRVDDDSDEEEICPYCGIAMHRCQCQFNYPK